MAYHSLTWRTEVKKIVAGFKDSPSPDPYGTPASWLKTIVDVVAEPLAKFINGTLENGIFPDCLTVTRYNLQKINRNDFSKYMHILLGFLY